MRVTRWMGLAAIVAAGVAASGRLAQAADATTSGVLSPAAGALPSEPQGEVLLQRIRTLKDNLSQLQSHQIKAGQQLAEQDRRQLQYQIGQFQAQLQYLHGTLDKLEQENAALLKARDDGDARILALNDELATINLQLAEERRARRVSDYQLGEQITQLTMERDRVLRDNAALISQLHSSEQLLAETSQALQEAKAAQASLTEQVATLQQANTALTAKVGEQDAQLERITRARDEATQRLAHVQPQVERMTDELAQARKWLADREAALTDTQAQLAEQIRENGRANATINQLKPEAGRLEVALAQTASAKAAVTAERDRLQQDIVKLKQQLETLKSAHAEGLRTQRQQLDQNDLVLKARVQGAQDEVARLRQQLEAAQTRITEREAQWQQLQQSLNDANAEEQRLVQELRQLQGASVMVAAERDAAREEAARLQARLNTVGDDQEMARSRSSAREDALEEDVRRLTQQLAAVTQAVQDRVRQVEQLQQQLAEERQARQVLEAKLETVPTLTKEQGALSERSAMLASRLDEMVTLNAEQAQELKARTAQWEEAQRQLIEAQQARAAAAAHADALQRDVDRLTAERLRLRGLLQDHEARTLRGETPSLDAPVATMPPVVADASLPASDAATVLHVKEMDARLEELRHNRIQLETKLAETQERVARLQAEAHRAQIPPTAVPIVPSARPTAAPVVPAPVASASVSVAPPAAAVPSSTLPRRSWWQRFMPAESPAPASSPVPVVTAPVMSAAPAVAQSSSVVVGAPPIAAPAAAQPAVPAPMVAARSATPAALGQDIRFNLAMICIQQQRFQEAADQLEQVVRQNPQDVEARYLLALLYRDDLQQPRRAETHYEAYRQLVPVTTPTEPPATWLAQPPVVKTPLLRAPQRSTAQE